MSENFRQSEKAEMSGANNIPDWDEMEAHEDDGFTIRDYVASVRETDIRKCWPLPMNILDSFLSRGFVPPLPPLRTAPKKLRRKTVPPGHHQNRKDENQSWKEAQHPLSVLEMNAPSNSSGVMGSSSMPLMNQSHTATEGPRVTVKESKGKADSEDNTALLQGGLPPESEQQKNLLAEPSGIETATMIPGKEAPNMDVSSISISNVDGTVRDYNVGDTQLETVSHAEQEIGLQLERIQLYSEGEKVAQNEGELVNSSSDAGPEPNTSMEPFPDAAECPISLGSQSPTIVPMNAASLTLPMKKRHLMAEAQMLKGKKRKVRTKLQQNEAMHDELSRPDVGKMIALRTQPLAGDNYNELPSNEVSVSTSISPS